MAKHGGAGRLGIASRHSIADLPMLESKELSVTRRAHVHLLVQARPLKEDCLRSQRRDEREDDGHPRRLLDAERSRAASVRWAYEVP